LRQFSCSFSRSIERWLAKVNIRRGRSPATIARGVSFVRRPVCAAFGAALQAVENEADEIGKQTQGCPAFPRISAIAVSLVKSMAMMA
jgi:hypothetical protein